MKELKVKLRYNSNTMSLMDEFEGIGDKNIIRYDRLVIFNENLIGYVESGKAFNYAVVLDRGGHVNIAGSITMTQFKSAYLRPYVSVARQAGIKKILFGEHIKNEITDEIYKEYVDSGKMYKLSVPYGVKAQNKHNRMGYGNIYNGDQLVYEGTKYGETTSYVIIGVYIYSSDGYWGIYDRQWGDVKLHH